ncbi:hypothetical protein PCA31118_01653 [Pandoraea captiosa]|uniref:Uncharacterized protein n=1 Tax=Pandoraea captiosa TaxID=2508302 RepID=A0A5E4ZT94_9BURK|nr:hypothetical protein [Pandoraea captiosa]VVE64581.1 hypothetical protein PCA31118_01653 [Pandoraea captiosa]
MHIAPDQIYPRDEVVRADFVLKLGPGDWLAWWYCGIRKNYFDNAQPLVLVDFRQLVNGKVSGNSVLWPVPIALLSKFSVGSIWNDGESRQHVGYPVKEFDVSYDEGGWCVSSFEEAFDSGAKPPYPIGIHRLSNTYDKNKLLMFDLVQGGKLVVPCLEFYSRCYGRSSNLRRLLAADPWQDWQSPSSKFYAPLGEPEEPDVWKVKLRRQMANGDVIFLAHAKYDEYTARAARSINSQIQAQFQPSKASIAFIDVMPWHRGRARLKVAGIPFGDDGSFLALNIVGGSEPGGAPLHRLRDTIDASKSGAEGLGGFPIGGRRQVLSPDIVHVTADDSPDGGAETVEVWDTAFEVLGTSRVVHDSRHRKTARLAVPFATAESPHQYAAGDSHGGGKGIGHLSVVPLMDVPPNGVLRDTWSALLHLQKKYVIESVEWYSIEHGFQSQGEPKLIPLCAVPDDVAMRKSDRNWVYIDRQLRSILLASVVVRGLRVCFLEIERKMTARKIRPDLYVEREEALRGMVYVPKSADALTAWVAHMRERIPVERGIIRNLESTTFGWCKAFKHKPSEAPQVAGEASLLSGLEKLGVSLKLRKAAS